MSQFSPEFLWFHEESRFMVPNRVKSTFLIVPGWIAAVELFTLIRFFGLKFVTKFRDADLGRIDHSWLVFSAALLGEIVRTAHFILDRFMDKPSIRRRPYGALILFQTVGNVGFVIGAFFTVTMLEVVRGETEGLIDITPGRLFTINFLITLIYVTLVSLPFGFLKTVNRKIGPGNLWKLIIGNYHLQGGGVDPRAPRSERVDHSP